MAAGTRTPAVAMGRDIAMTQFNVTSGLGGGVSRPTDGRGRAEELANPVLPLPARVANRVLARSAPRQWPFDAETIKARAIRATGLNDFGADVPLDEPLAALCGDLDAGPPMHPLGRYATVRGLVTSMANRLRLQRLTLEQPGDFDRPVPAPLIIVGLPRSGTTLLHRLIAQDPGRRYAPFWEVNLPLPQGDVPPDGKPDPRIKSGAAAIKAMYWIAPQMRQMHEVQNEAAEEEIQLLTMGFCSAFYHTIACSPPRFTAWYNNADHVPAYRLFNRILQSMQWARPGPDHWILKTPSHLHHLPALQTVFPDATLVQTHRDPVTSIVSSANMVTYLHRGYYPHPHPPAVAHSIATFVEDGLRTADRDRRDTDARIVDLHYHRLLADPLGAVDAVYAAAGRTITDEARRRMTTWLADNRQHKHGVHHYAAQDFDLDVPALRNQFRFYYDRFDVREEP
jgi:hypothetical protein